MFLFLSHAAIESALIRLGELAFQEGSQTEILIVGGAAMVLEFGARSSTKDVDFSPVSETDLPTIRRLAAKSLGSSGISDLVLMFGQCFQRKEMTKW